MKLTAQAEFYIEHYGVEEGIKYLKTLGYNQIVYAISGRTKNCLLTKMHMSCFAQDCNNMI